MVSTRHHKADYDGTPAPTPSRSSTSAPSTSPSQAVATRKATRAAAASSSSAWSHTPSNLTLIWLAVSLPLVIWDTGYVLGRPHTMEGGFLHSPIWTPYKLYGEVDYVYGWPAYTAKDGFTAAQGSLNTVETLGYLVYLYMVYAYGVQTPLKGRGAAKSAGKLSHARVISGRKAAVAVLIAFSMAVMTLSKTVLYWANEYFSGFKHIGHNDATSLLFLWIIPNGAWLILPTYMIYVFGAEILEGLENSAAVKRD